MSKRVMSKKWEVDPDYEPPVTRQKVRQDPSIVIPRAHDVPLPTANRKKRVKVIAPAPAEPDLKNAEVVAPENEAMQAESGDQMKEVTPKNHGEEEVPNNQIEEMVTMGQMDSQTEEITVRNQAEEMAGINQVDGTLEDSQPEENTMWNQREEVVGNQTKNMVTGNQIESLEGEILEGLLDIQTEKITLEHQIEYEAPMYQIDGTSAWTETDQNTIEKEIKDSAAKPEHEKRYSWNLIVGMSGVSQEGSRAPNLRPGESDQCFSDGYMPAVDKSATNHEIALASASFSSWLAEPDNTGSLSKAGTEGILKKVQSTDTVENLGNVMKKMTINNMAVPSPDMVGQKTTLETPGMADKETSMEYAHILNQVPLFKGYTIIIPQRSDTNSGMQNPQMTSGAMTRMQPMGAMTTNSTASSKPVMVNKETMVQHSYTMEQITPHTGNGNASLEQLESYPAANASKETADGTAVQHQVPETGEWQTTTSSSLTSSQAVLRIAEPNNDQSGRQSQLRQSSVVSALRRNALLLGATEPVTEKPDILTERRFVPNPNYKGHGYLNAAHPFSVVSYSITAEPEKEVCAQAGGLFGGAASGIGFGQVTGMAGTSLPLMPLNYVDKIVTELYFLQPDVFCFQSIAGWYYDRLERLLNNWGYTGYKASRRPGEGNHCEAVFYKTQRFLFVHREKCYIDDLINKQMQQPGVIHTDAIRDSVASREGFILLTLRCRLTDRMLRIVNTRCVPEHKHRPDLQALQVCSILQEVAKRTMNPHDPVATVLCGNLDFKPSEGPYQLLRDGVIKEATEQVFNAIDSATVSRGQKCPLATVYRVGFQHPMATMKSAYAKVLGEEPPNVWKRESETFVCGSYVWFDETQLSVVGVLDKVASKVVTATGIPNEHFPSSSLSLKTQFQFAED